MPVKLKHHFGGWKPQLPDHRDKKLSLAGPVVLPPLVDLRTDCFEPSIYNQGQLGSCTANAIGALFEAELKKQGLTDFMPSRLFIYYNERVMEGDPSVDGGAEIRDGMKSLATQGVCPETNWPYIENLFAKEPPALCYASGLLNKATSYLAVNQDIFSLKSCLALGYRFTFGITVYDSFESGAVASSGMVPIPGQDESVLGGHAIACVGYDDSKQCFIMRNSWGTTWGLAGYFYLPYSYVLNTDLASDFWTLRLVA